MDISGVNFPRILHVQDVRGEFQFLVLSAQELTAFLDHHTDSKIPEDEHWEILVEVFLGDAYHFVALN